MGKILEDSRSLFSGPISHFASSLEVELDSIPLLDLLKQVDLINLNTGLPGTGGSSDPSVTEVTELMKAVLAPYITPLDTALNKPMIVCETVMNSFDGAIQSWDMTGWPSPGAMYDSSEQTIWYEAWFSAKQSFPSVVSYGLLSWSYWPASGGYGDLGNSARLKPAEVVIAAEFRANNYSTMIVLDGETDDWEAISNQVRVVDGSSGISGNHIVDLSAVGDDWYIYLAVRLREAALPDQIISVTLDINADFIADMPLGIFWIGALESDPCRNWMATLGGVPMRYDKLVGIVDMRADCRSTVFEVRIPWSMLPAGKEVLNLRATLIDNARRVEIGSTLWLSLER